MLLISLNFLLLYIVNYWQEDGSWLYHRWSFVRENERWWRFLHPPILNKILFINNLFIDPYKSEGQIILKIEKFSEFVRERPGNRRLSDPVYICGLPWNILAIGRRQKCLGYFLQCNRGNAGPYIYWHCIYVYIFILC